MSKRVSVKPKDTKKKCTVEAITLDTPTEDQSNLTLKEIQRVTGLLERVILVQEESQASIARLLDMCLLAEPGDFSQPED